MSVELQNIRHIAENGEDAYENMGFKEKDDTTSINSMEKPPLDSKASSMNDVVFTMPEEERGKPLESSTDTLDSEAAATKPGCFAEFVESITTGIAKVYEEHNVIIWRVIYIVLILLYAAYFAWAMYTERLIGENSIRLCWVTCVVVFGVVIHFVWKAVGKHVKKCLKPCLNFLDDNSEMISWIVVAIIYAFVIIFVIVDVAVVTKDPYNLLSGFGILLYVALMFIFSYSPQQVKWRPVAWGLAIQFILALLILRWSYGYDAFTWLGERVDELLAHTDAGSEFIFGPSYQIHFFAFKILPVVIFFSSLISILYYLGVMQAVIRVIACGMQALMGTTAAESLNAAGNIFIGQSEAPLMIKPLLPDMTKSEIHAVMSGGFATIAGTVLAAYILFGVPANHLITASVMSAPAALAIAKLFYPETEQSKTTAKDVKNMAKGSERNIIEAASAGASASIALVANIAANLIAFIALLHFVNHTLCWFAARIGFDLYPNCQVLETIFSYLLYPFAFVMGVNAEDCRKMGRLIGIKTMINEFVAYQDLGIMIANTDIHNTWTSFNGTSTLSYDSAILHGAITVDDTQILSETFITWATQMLNGTLSYPFTLEGDYTLAGSIMTDRSIVIATYALCGFSNVGSIGIMLGSLGAMAPERKSDISATVVRAMIAGNVACFITACIAGLLYRGAY